MANREIITHYIRQEGGFWERCNWQLPSETELARKQIPYDEYSSKHNATCYLYRRKVHGIRTNTGRIWDTLNGWRNNANHT